jgi:hypothetical protein
MLPQLILYFDTKIDHERQFIELIFEYLTIQKKVIDVSAAHLSEASSSISPLDQLVKFKQLGQFQRAFEDKRFLNSTFRSRLLEYALEMCDKISKNLSENREQASLLSAIVLVVPFIFTCEDNDKRVISDKIDELIYFLIEQTKMNMSKLEITRVDSFILSISIWSQILLSSTRNDLSGILGSILELFNNLNQLENEVKLANEGQDYELSAKHLTRGVFYLLNFLKCQSGKMIDFLNSAFDVFKLNLSTPDHEVNSFF